MIRGTTPTNTFTSTVDLSDAEVVYITYDQRGETVVEKTKEDITFYTPEQTQENTPTTYAFSVQLTQEETLRFTAKHSVEIQVRARFSNGSAPASKIISTTADRVLKEGVI